MPWHDYPLMPIMATRGCPFGCEYCVVTTIHGKSYRHRPVEHIIEEIESTNAEFYFFVDDNILTKYAYTKELFEGLAWYRKKKTAKEFTWFAQGSTTILKKPELIDLAAEAGCVSMFIGIESINEEALGNVAKSFNRPAQYHELFQRYYHAGIVPYTSLIFGFDEDDHHNDCQCRR